MTSRIERLKEMLAKHSKKEKLIKERELETIEERKHKALLREEKARRYQSNANNICKSSVEQSMRDYKL